MKKVIIVSLLSFIIMFTGCSNLSNSKYHYNLENFKNDMTEKGYDFEIQDVSLYVLHTKAKRMTFDDNIIDIFTFSSNKKMESQARNIVSGRWGFDNGTKMISSEWVSVPHYYKKGKIIVQYIGVNDKIISDLNEIFGEQFAG